MDTLSCIDIQKKVLEKLESDSVLAEYVEVFSIGEEQVSHKRFPYVVVVEVTDDIGPICIGPGAPNMNQYRIVIQGGIYHILPRVARKGDDTGKKGIVQLTDDIVAAVFPDNLYGIFNPTLHLSNASPKEVDGSAGRNWMTTVTLTGSRKY